jgi:23S rRNA pseudouridine1911/1915/1917 synthase
MDFNRERGQKYGVRHHLALSSGPLGQILHSELSLEQKQIRDLLSLGAIYLNHQRVRSLDDIDQVINPGDYLRAHLEPRRFPLATQVRLLEKSELVVFENSEMLIINKPVGVPVHPTVDNQVENMLFALGQIYNQELFITHRLDIPTSGLIVYAKTKDFQRQFNTLLTAGKVRKIYSAIVEGHYAGPEHLVHYMEPSPRAPKRVLDQPPEVSDKTWLKCELQILNSEKIVSPSGELQSRLSIELLTGRTHQIRCQLSFMGYPIIGDAHYGAKTIYRPGIDAITLTAVELTFPIDGKMTTFRLPANS